MMSSPAILESRSKPIPAATRRIVHRTLGRKHGPIVRLMSPSDLGELLKPFVFLDYVNVDATGGPGFGIHPHSGIATLTLLIEGGVGYEDSTGETGEMSQGAVEWMQAGGGVWHRGNSIGERIKGYQLWVALPPEIENSPPVSRYLDAASFSAVGPARVILGELGGVRSPIAAPSSMNYLEVRLKAGEVWRYDPPEAHETAWVSVFEGRVLVPQPITPGELVVFAEEATSIVFRAEVDSGFILGTAKKHPHPLVLGDYSIHTTAKALRNGEAGIRRIADDLRRAGKI
jgi:redox-sensitive bicupin YhaK (pirin superfamily)